MSITINGSTYNDNTDVIEAVRDVIISIDPNATLPEISDYNDNTHVIEWIALLCLAVSAGGGGSVTINGGSAITIEPNNTVVLDGEVDNTLRQIFLDTSVPFPPTLADQRISFFTGQTFGFAWGNNITGDFRGLFVQALTTSLGMKEGTLEEGFEITSQGVKYETTTGEGLKYKDVASQQSIDTSTPLSITSVQNVCDLIDLKREETFSEFFSQSNAITVLPNSGGDDDENILPNSFGTQIEDKITSVGFMSLNTSPPTNAQGVSIALEFTLEPNSKFKGVLSSRILVSDGFGETATISIIEFDPSNPNPFGGKTLAEENVNMRSNTSFRRYTVSDNVFFENNTNQTVQKYAYINVRNNGFNSFDFSTLSVKIVGTIER